MIEKRVEFDNQLWPPVGVYTLDVITQKGNTKAAYEGILVISQQPTTVISEATRNVINQEINQNKRVVIDDDDDDDNGLRCPPGYERKGDECKPKPCPPGYERKGDECKPKPPCFPSFGFCPPDPCIENPDLPECQDPCEENPDVPECQEQPVDCEANPDAPECQEQPPPDGQLLPVPPAPPPEIPEEQLPFEEQPPIDEQPPPEEEEAFEDEEPIDEDVEEEEDGDEEGEDEGDGGEEGGPGG